MAIDNASLARRSRGDIYGYVTIGTSPSLMGDCRVPNEDACLDEVRLLFIDFSSRCGLFDEGLAHRRSMVVCASARCLQCLREGLMRYCGCGVKANSVIELTGVFERTNLAYEEGEIHPPPDCTAAGPTS